MNQLNRQSSCTKAAPILRIGASCLLGFALLSAMGCGNGLAHVEGQIVLDGQPIAGSANVSATVYFYPEDGAGTPAMGRIDESGKYILKTGGQMGVEPGSYLVTVRASEFVGANDSNLPRKSRLLTPPQYNNPAKSGLRAEVIPGSNTLDFAMQSPSKQASHSARR